MELFAIIAGLVLVAYGLSAVFDSKDQKFDGSEYETEITESKAVEVTDIKMVEVEPCTAAPKNTPRGYIDQWQNTVVRYYDDIPLSHELQEYITNQCLEKFGTLNYCGVYMPALVMNIIRWESGFVSTNDNGKCCGLMSVTKKLSDTIIEEENIDDLIDPKQNIRAGIRILKNCFNRVWAVDSQEEAFKKLPESKAKRVIVTNALDMYHTGACFIGEHFDSEYVKNILSTLQKYENVVDWNI